MGHTVVVAHLPTASPAIREEYIKKLKAASEYALTHEPGIRKYAILLPRDSADLTSVYAFEEYADKATLDAHMETPGVKDMIKWSTSEKLFDGTPTIHQLEFIDSFDFSRAGVNNTPDPHVIFADLSYHSGAVPQSLPYWKDVVETSCNDEPGTLVYGILKDPKDPDKVYTLEAYESPQYLADVHVPSKAIQESIKNTKHLRTGLRHTFLKLHAGFLHRE